MGISDYIWPFERKFSHIPCAREAGIAALMGGPCTGAVAIAMGKPLLSFKVSLYAGFAMFWVTFGVCRYNYHSQKKFAEQFTEAYRAGKLD